jgi:hypothetical protein
MGTREEDYCEIVEAAMFQRRGNEQRCQIQHLANGEETAVRIEILGLGMRDDRKGTLKLEVRIPML